MKRKHIPRWAHRERLYDMGWIAHNIDILRGSTRNERQLHARGAIVVDVTKTKGGGHPISFLSQCALQKTQHTDAKHMVREYVPMYEVVVVIVKKNRESTYRVRFR